MVGLGVLATGAVVFAAGRLMSRSVKRAAA